MTIRELTAKLGLDLDLGSLLKAEGAFEVMHEAVNLLKEGLEKVGDAILESVVGTAEQAHHLEILSQQTGISTDALQAWGYAGSLAGIDADTMAMSVGRLSRQVEQARQGSQQAALPFAKLGVSLYTAGGQAKEAEELLGDIADRFKVMPDGTKKTAAAMGLFGRQGRQLIPTLNKGSQGIAELRVEMEQLGVFMDKDAIESGSELSATMIRLKALSTGLARTFGEPLLRPLAEAGKQFLEWAKANRELIKTRIEGFVHGLVTVVKALASVVAFVVRNWKLFAIILGSVITPILLAQIPLLIETITWYVALGIQAATAGIQAAAAWLAAEAPIIAIAAALALAALAAEDVYTFLQGGDSLLGRIGPKWLQFVDDFTKPHEGDPWWLKLIREFVGAITDIPGTFDRVVKQIRGQLSDMVGDIKADLGPIANFFGGNLGIAAPAGSPAAAFGGGASPIATAAAGGGGGGLVNINSPIAVTQAPGEDGKDFAVRVARLQREHLAGELQAAAKATE